MKPTTATTMTTRPIQSHLFFRKAGMTIFRSLREG
jgi:hypothetical protein